MQRAVSLSAINPRHQNPVTTPPGSSMTGAVSHAGPGDQNPDHRGYLEGNGVRVSADSSRGERAENCLNGAKMVQ